MQLIEILKEVLVEAKSPQFKAHKNRDEGPIRPQVRDALKNSINHKWLLNIYYEGDKENAPGRRWIEPYVWGLHKKSGNNVLRAWQYKGKTTTIQPGWKMFRLDRIRNTAPLTTKTFKKPRPLFNPDDKHMSTYIERVDFGRSGGGNNIPKAPKNTPTSPVNKNKQTVSRLKSRRDDQKKNDSKT